MPTKVIDMILPTTMIGSYPKPRWFEEYNVAGADLLEWWKLEKHFQAYRDATAACIKDQEIAGLDIVTDGQMHFDQYGGGIGSFVWYWYERLGGFNKGKLPNPIARGIEASGEDLSQAAWMHASSLSCHAFFNVPLIARDAVEGVQIRQPAES
jgi:hypothetical protein